VDAMKIPQNPVTDEQLVRAFDLLKNLPVLRASKPEDEIFLEEILTIFQITEILKDKSFAFKRIAAKVVIRTALQLKSKSTKYKQMIKSIGI
jgi:hypothetical protein